MRKFKKKIAEFIENIKKLLETYENISESIEHIRK